MRADEDDDGYGYPPGPCCQMCGRSLDWPPGQTLCACEVKTTTPRRRRRKNALPTEGRF